MRARRLLAVALAAAALGTAGLQLIAAGPAAAAPDVYASDHPVNCDGRAEEFKRAANGTLVHRYETRPWDQNSWTGWQNLGGAVLAPPASGPVAILNWDCRMEVFMIGADRAVHHKWQDPNATGGWSGWESLGGSVDTGLNARRFGGGPYTNIVEVYAWADGDRQNHFKRQTSPGQGPWIGWY